MCIRRAPGRHSMTGEQGLLIINANMFKKLDKTKYLPGDKPLMAWDGDCGFCHYWVIKWMKLTGKKVEYKPFQEAYKDFPDIELKYFKQAIRFIDVDGKIYTGPAAVFQALHKYGRKWRWVMPIYRNFWPFRFASDHHYAFVSRNRTRMYGITVRLFGKNPARPKYYWAVYAGSLIATGLILLIVF